MNTPPTDKKPVENGILRVDSTLDISRYDMIIENYQESYWLATLSSQYELVKRPRRLGQGQLSLQLIR